MKNDLEQAIPVNSIAEEYDLIAAEGCPCGASFQVVRQSLLQRSGRPYDLLEATCPQCRRQRQFLFDIGSFFGQPAAGTEE